MTAQGAPRGPRKLARLMQWIAVASAALSLPTDLFSPLWLVLFSLPGVLFLWLSTGSRERFMGFTDRLGLAVLTVIGLSFAIYQTPAAPVPQAALTYLLLPPLAYATLRRRPLDVLHSLFLSFCLLVIGSILEGTPSWLVLTYVFGSTFVLQSEACRDAFLGRYYARSARAAKSAVLGQRVAVTLACLLAFTGIFGALQQLPFPGARPRGESGAKQVGISTSFDLTAANGPINLIDDELVVVRTSRDPVPHNLYLRCAYFDVASTTRWEVVPRRYGPDQGLRRRPWSRPRFPDSPAHRLHIERLEGESGLIYAPPGTFYLSGDFRLRSHTALEALSQVEPTGPISYTLRYQDLRNHALGRSVDRTMSGLTDLPRELRGGSFRALSNKLTRGAGRDPTELAIAISRGLQERCSYALEEPKGNSHVLDNFLFGNHQGYCMHFASAMAVLLRHQGIPCRVAVGLYGGRIDVEPRERVFGNRDAHAWVEIPLKGLGWVVFDPTPPVALTGNAERFPRSHRMAGLSPSDGNPIVDSGPAAGLDIDIPIRMLWPWLALISLIAVARFATPRRRPRSASKSEVTEEARNARRMLHKILDELSRRGLSRAEQQTLERYAATLAADTSLDTDAVIAAFAAYQDVRFGGRDLDRHHQQALRAGLQAARTRATS